MTIIDTHTGKAITQSVLLGHLAAADVVFIGEQHTDPAAHAFELSVLTGLHTRVGKRLTLGLEMFERDTQPTLDHYVQGKTTEAAFLRASRPWSNYAADYRPLIEFARAHAVPVLASNVPQPIATAVGRRGLSALTDFLADQYAPDVQTPHDGAFTRFQAVMQDMGGHGGMTMDAATIARFYDAQCLRDATMADSIAHRLDATPGALVLHLNGQFHSDYGDGIPRRVLWHRPLTKCVTVSVLNDAKAPPDSRALADYLVLPAPLYRQPASTFSGIMEPPTEGRQRLMAMTLTPETERHLRSFAEKRGLMPEEAIDVLLNEAIHEFQAAAAGIQHGMDDYAAGRWISLEDYEAQVR